MNRLTLEDIIVGMQVRTWQNKNLTRIIKEINDTVCVTLVDEKGIQYDKNLHWKNLYQALIDGEWVLFVD